MKVFLLGMVAVSALSPLIIAEAEPDATLARDFTWSMVGGVGGSLLCLVTWGAKDIQQMARDALGNLLIAMIFGPTACYYVAKKIGFEMGPHLIIPVSAVLGISGVSILRAVGPKILVVISSAIPSIIQKMMGGDKDKDWPPPQQQNN